MFKQATDMEIEVEQAKRSQVLDKIKHSTRAKVHISLVVMPVVSDCATIWFGCTLMPFHSVA